MNKQIVKRYYHLQYEHCHVSNGQMPQAVQPWCRLDGV